MKYNRFFALSTVLLSVACLASCGDNSQSGAGNGSNPGSDLGLKVGDKYRRLNGVTEDVKNGHFDSFETLDKDTWTVGQGYWGQGNGGVSPENVFITDNGELALRGYGNYYARNEITSYGALHDGRKCGATLISNYGVGPGHYEIKMKVFPRQGACTAFWTYANRTRPAIDGVPQENENAEIDIELPGGSRSNKISFKKNLNTNWITETLYETREYAIADVDPNATYVAYNDGEYHTFGFDWYTDPACVVYFCDGIITNISEIFNPTLEGRLWVGVWFPAGFVGDANFEEDFMYVDYIMYNPFVDQPYESFNAKPSVQAAGDSVYAKSPITAVPSNKISNGDFEFVGKITDEEKRDNIISNRGWEFKKYIDERKEQKEVCWIEKGIGTDNGESYAAFVRDGGILRQSIDSVYDGYTFDFSFNAKSDKANEETNYVELKFIGNGDSDVLGRKTFNIANANDFRKYQATVTAPVGTDSIQIEAFGGEGNRIIIDDVSLIKVNN